MINKHIAGCMAAMFLTLGVATAQNVRFGFRAGLNIPNITAGGNNTPVSEGYASRTASGMGVFTELQLTPAWSLRLGVEYSGQGGKKDGMQAMPTQRLVTEMATAMGTNVDQNIINALAGAAAQMPPYYYADISNTVKFDYVMIPLLAQYTIGLGNSPWSVYLHAGPFVSFLVSGKQVSKGSSRLYADASGTTLCWDRIDPQTQQQLSAIAPAFAVVLQNEIPFGSTNITGEMKSSNFGVTGNIGLRYRCGRNFFFIEGGGNYGLIAVQQDDTNGSNRLGAASVMVGYAFSFF
ncbi:MAG: PorT family protein [Bacteroidales bacterium]|jgi:hypothetical protein|nr:PorT family protein [Bacteroidales bacterium]